MAHNFWRTWWRESGEDELRAILMREWDPIGVADISEVADEYDDYVLHIGSMLADGTDEAEIAEYLRESREITIGVGSDSASGPSFEDTRTAQLCATAYRHADAHLKP